MTTPDIAALEAELDRLKKLVHVLMQNNPDGVAISDEKGTLVINPAGEAIFGAMSAPEPQRLEEWSTAYGLFLPDQKTVFPTEQLPLVRAIRGETIRDGLIFCRSAERPEGFWLGVTARPLEGGGAIAIFRDITDRKKLEEELTTRNAELAARAAENGALIERLRLAVEELSTPVLEIWDDVLALPVVGVVDTQRSAQMVERLLAEVVARRSRFVIVDLTGVDVIDTSTADRFMKLARSVELLGAQCVVTGIQPAVSQTLVELGVEFSGLATQRNLKRALEVCMARIARVDQRTRRAVST